MSSGSAQKPTTDQLEIRTEHSLLINAMLVAVPFTNVLTGFIFIQFARFMASSQSKGQRYARIWGSVAILLHLMQLAFQIENFRVTCMHYVVNQFVDFSLYEAMGTIYTLGIVLIVQIHFLRITHAITSHKLWLLSSIFVLLLAAAGGLSTAIFFILEIIKGRIRKKPTKFSHRLTISWIVWLVSATAFDLILTVVLVRRLVECRTWTIHLRSCLGKLLALSIQTFFLTCIASSLSMVLISVARFTPITDSVLLTRLETAALINNAMLPRIYLISFFSTLTDTIKGKEEMTPSSCDFQYMLDRNEFRTVDTGVLSISSVV
ncbi:uncharacterized protein MELLADRAFT_71848 [Melampsora larici-populina 98AG31]|uniref:G-protein coupled receptors family 1 profile domain-containing protein n=1 Tax=Melampsora larici-populina (strain 98AG31 / pathotype 3-4-7) TaxID=747676 RepID=F4RL29_MELLP|nr:uncharacterized protein MELLADRAFT_71848 [Melampsora larici-populina 98AG31]EGG06832.1 hypothetical protein MELLADRAFT_71848 [Melampsora larici-populina 98AG31]